ncbi:MAG: glycosyltransferase [Armatimonadota bacterium]
MKQPRPVLFQLVTSLVPAGAERVVLNLLKYHDRHRYEPVCICLMDPTGSHYEQQVQQMGIPLHFLGKGDKADWGAFRKLDALFRQYRPTIVHTHLLALNYAYPLMIRYRTPVRVHTVHSLAQHELGTRVSRIVRMLAFRYRIGGVVPVAIAEEVRRTIEQLYGYRNAPLIPNGIPTEEYAPDSERRARWRAAHGIEPEAIVITHVGRFVEVKNHALLVSAFARLQSPTPLYLLLVGGGELEKAVRQQVVDLGLGERVRFLGVRADVPDILNASDVFALSSKWEGNPMSVQEAMASGLPVVSTAVGGVPELVQEGVTGLLVPPDDPNALAHALQTLVDQPEQRRQMGESARHHACQHFDIRRTVQQYEALYEHLLQSACRQRQRAE